MVGYIEVKLVEAEDYSYLIPVELEIEFYKYTTKIDRANTDDDSYYDLLSEFDSKFRKYVIEGYYPKLFTTSDYTKHI